VAVVHFNLDLLSQHFLEWLSEITKIQSVDSWLSGRGSNPGLLNANQSLHQDFRLSFRRKAFKECYSHCAVSEGCQSPPKLFRDLNNNHCHEPWATDCLPLRDTDVHRAAPRTP